jgi:sarcosine oxidase subunit gamma
VLGATVSPDGAAVADQLSGWTVLELSGDNARDVLARLAPIDLREGALPEGATSRTVIGQMTGSMTRTGVDIYEVMVFRSMAGTAVHELERAMKGVAARKLVRAQSGLSRPQRRYTRA